MPLLIKFPSNDRDSDLSFFGVIPEAMSLEQAKQVADDIILRVNHEDYESGGNGCESGRCVQDEMTCRLRDKGFFIPDIETQVVYSLAWDEYHGAAPEPARSRPR